MSPLVGVRRALLSRPPVAAAAPGGWLPTSEAGLAFWYRADAIVGKSDGDAVSPWSDESGNARDSAQATSTKRPLYKTGRVNGLPSLLFDGTDDYLTVSFTFGQPEHLFLVAKRVTWVDDARVVSGFGSNLLGEVYSDGGSPQFSVYAGAGPITHAGTAWAVGSFELVEILFNGASSSARINADSATTGSAGTSSMAGLTLGGSGLGANCANVEIAEAFGYTAVKSGTPLASIQSYAQTKYALW